MRKLFLGLAVGAIALLGTQTAQAGPLTGATLTFSLGTLPPIAFTGLGTGAGTSNLSPNGFFLNPFAVPTGTATTTVPISAAPPISKIALVINGNPSTFDGTANPGGFSLSTRNAVAVTGVANVIAYGGITLLAVPIVLGAPNTALPPPAYGVGITAFANSWTDKLSTLNLVSPTDNGATTVMATGSNMLELTTQGGGAGMVTLVSGLNVLTNLAGQLPSFALLKLTFAGNVVPEPGTLLLLGSGIAGLVILGGRKLRK